MAMISAFTAKSVNESSRQSSVVGLQLRSACGRLKTEIDGCKRITENTDACTKSQKPEARSYSGTSGAPCTPHER